MARCVFILRVLASESQTDLTLESIEVSVEKGVMLVGIGSIVDKDDKYLSRTYSLVSNKSR